MRSGRILVLRVGLPDPTIDRLGEMVTRRQFGVGSVGVLVGRAWCDPAEPNIRFVSADIALSRVPASSLPAEQLARFDVVFDLRPWSEAASGSHPVAEVVRLPIELLDMIALIEFNALLLRYSGKRILVHDGSGEVTGAIWAAHRLTMGTSIADAAREVAWLIPKKRLTECLQPLVGERPAIELRT